MLSILPWINLSSDLETFRSHSYCSYEYDRLIFLVMRLSQNELDLSCSELESSKQVARRCGADASASSLPAIKQIRVEHDVFLRIEPML